MLAKVKLQEISRNDRKNYINYLLLADDSTEIIDGYINEGNMYAIVLEETIVGVVLFTFSTQEVVEIKNIAIDEKYRGRGLGKAVIESGLSLYRKKKYVKMVVGTANSSIGNIAFYQKVGFRIDSIKKDFFTQYPKEIYEHGIKAQDMIMFIKTI